MKVSKDKVVLMHYTLKNDKSEVIDSSEGKDPLAFLQGHGNIIPGLEKALEGCKLGDKKGGFYRARRCLRSSYARRYPRNS